MTDPETDEYGQELSDYERERFEADEADYRKRKEMMEEPEACGLGPRRTQHFTDTMPWRLASTLLAKLTHSMVWSVHDDGRVTVTIVNNKGGMVTQYKGTETDIRAWCYGIGAGFTAIDRAK